MQGVEGYNQREKVALLLSARLLSTEERLKKKRQPVL